MKGTVVLINPKNGFFAIQVEADDFTVAEMLDGYDVEVGDIISGNLHYLGDGQLKNETRQTVMSVLIQDIHSSASKAWAMAFH